jgi:hypothetical protein
LRRMVTLTLYYRVFLLAYNLTNLQANWRLSVSKQQTEPDLIPNSKRQ